MAERIKLREAVIVEGKYDKITLESVIDALIITTDGFALFKNSEKRALIRRLANERGILVITDSDGAGFVIRNHIAGLVDRSKIKHAYIPQLLGKERRKDAPSKEGTLGVEGMSREVLLNALKQAGVQPDGVSEDERRQDITRERLFDDGFIGTSGSAQRRELLLKALGLPSGLSTSALIKIINTVADMEEYERAVEMIDRGGES